MAQNSAPHTNQDLTADRHMHLVNDQASDHLAPDLAGPDSAKNNQTDVARPFQGDDFARDVWCVLGLPVDVASVASAAIEIDQAARDGRRLAFVTPNVNMVCAATKNPAARADIVDHELSLADGAPLVALAKLAGVPLPERCAGSDVFEALRNRAGFPGRRIRVFFFGGRDGAAALANDALNNAPGGLEGVGFLNPGFGDVAAMSTPRIIDEINAARPDFVVVALGAEKGNRWIAENADRLTAPVVSHLGAVVDFTAGGVKRAPKWVSRAGLEFAWRIAQEPALWRRYWNDGLSLARLVATRALPLALFRQTDSGQPAAAVFQSGVITLSGDLKRNDLSSIRTAMRDASSANGDICLDMKNVGSMDASFLGLVLMLEKNLRRRGAQMTIQNATAQGRRYLRLNGFVADAPLQRDDGASGRHGIAEAA